MILADDASFKISNRNFGHFLYNVKLSSLSCDWMFAANTLVLNSDKTNTITFIMYNFPHGALSISYKEKYVDDVVNTRFLGLQIDKHP